MGIHRYWRIVGIQTTSNTDLELSEFRFYNLGNLVDTSCVITSSVVPFSGNLSYLIDNNSTDVVLWKYSSWSQSGFSIKYDFGSGQGVEYPKFRIGSGSSQSTWLQDCIIQYSDDNINWIGYINLTNINYPGVYSLTALPDSDPVDTSCVLLLNGNGTNGSSLIIDSSVSSPKTVTVVGNAQISMAQSKFGGSSLSFDGAGDYLSVPTSDDFNFYAGDFTIEFFAYFLTVGTTLTSNYNGIVCRDNIGISRGWLVLTDRDLSGKLNIACFSGATTFMVGTVSAPLVNSWSHYAFQRSGSSMMCFKDGILQGTTNIGTAILNSSSDPVYVGCLRNTNSPMFSTFLDGYIDDLRITKGVARYTANFTPPTAELSIYPIALDAYTARFNRTSNLPNRILPTLELPIGSGYSVQKEYLFNDIYYGGSGLISGTTKIKNTVSNIPAMKRVVLIDERSKLVIAERWSDSVTGYFEFRGFRTDILYTLLSYDHTGAFNAVVAVSVVPTLII